MTEHVPDHIPDEVVTETRWFTSDDTAHTVMHWRERLAEATERGASGEEMSALSALVRLAEDEDRDMQVREEEG